MRPGTGSHVRAHASSHIYETRSSSGEMAPEHCPRILRMIAANAFPLAERRHREYVQGARAERSVALTARVVAVYALNMVVHLATNTIMEARMTDQAVSKTEPAQPTLTEDEPAGNLPAEEISTDGICDAY